MLIVATQYADYEGHRRQPCCGREEGRQGVIFAAVLAAIVSFYKCDIDGFLLASSLLAVYTQTWKHDHAPKLSKARLLDATCVMLCDTPCFSLLRPGTAPARPL